MIELVQERMRTSEIARIAKAEKAAAELDLEQLRVELVQAINAAPAAMLERERFRAEAEVAAEATNDELLEQSMRTTEVRFQARSSAGTPPDEHGSANDTEACDEARAQAVREDARSGAEEKNRSRGPPQDAWPGSAEEGAGAESEAELLELFGTLSEDTEVGRAARPTSLCAVQAAVKLWPLCTSQRVSARVSE